MKIIANIITTGLCLSLTALLSAQSSLLPDPANFPEGGRIMNGSQIIERSGMHHIPGWAMNSWDAASTVGMLRESIGTNSEMSVGIWNEGPKAAVQFYSVPLKIVEGRYTLKTMVRCDSAGTGVLIIKLDDTASIETAMFGELEIPVSRGNIIDVPATGGGWKLVEVTIVVRGEAEISVSFRNKVIGKEYMFYFKDCSLVLN